MKKITRILTALTAAAFLISVSGCGNSTAVTEENYAFNPDNQAYWREVLQKYRKDDSVHQVMLVRCTEGSNAIVQFYNKLTDQNNAWTLLFETDAYIGKNGTGKTQEGDAKTPLGDFGVQYAFGILNNPGTALDYVDIKESTFACDEDCEFYNQLIDLNETEHDCKGEEMFIYTPEYNYGIVTDYNAENEYPKGSEIFLHCKGAKVFTGGCIAIDEECMKTVLQYADPGMRIIIHEEYKTQETAE
ncbi:MAG: L,D-transpeptidase family protein [Clostridia bacterium]|nr:L,D-transpeptidase family protein [Clostridia bacterium]